MATCVRKGTTYKRHKYKVNHATREVTCAACGKVKTFSNPANRMDAALLRKAARRG